MVLKVESSSQEATQQSDKPALGSWVRRLQRNSLASPCYSLSKKGRAEASCDPKAGRGPKSEHLAQAVAKEGGRSPTVRTAGDPESGLVLHGPHCGQVTRCPQEYDTEHSSGHTPTREPLEHAPEQTHTRSTQAASRPTGSLTHISALAPHPRRLSGLDSVLWLCLLASEGAPREVQLARAPVLARDREGAEVQQSAPTPRKRG